ncbi:CorA family divalent cation transporter [Leifsonia poae]|uniref:Magnesium transport protein CorA n=1 Tax=Leifsonia poae TaxID=110933 RepID=A0A9W6LZR7_9MICO|nr:CorA family divalent cation transporter [Leifsonia poae]GLJ76170.1 magnesium transport protein CorA [Leifsonia poae]
MQLSSAEGRALSVRRYSADGAFTQSDTISTDDIGDNSSSEAGGFVWIGLAGHDPAQLEALGTGVGLHPLVRDDIAGGRQQPKVQWFDEQLFIVLRVLESAADGSETTMSELYVFARPGLLVTVGSRRGSGSFDVSAALDAAYPGVLGFGTLGGVHAIVARVVRGYLAVARDIEEDLVGLEDQVFDETQKDDTLRIYQLRRRIGRVDRAVTTLAVAFGNSRDKLVDYSRLHPGLAPYVLDLIEDLAGAARLADDQRSALDGVISSHENAVASEQNSDSRTISAFAALLAIPAVVAGIYGMNFKDLPATNWPYGWVLIVALIVALELWAYIALKKRHWF